MTQTASLLSSACYMAHDEAFTSAGVPSPGQAHRSYTNQALARHWSPEES
jgi:hypothetical protein